VDSPVIKDGTRDIMGIEGSVLNVIVIGLRVKI